MSANISLNDILKIEDAIDTARDDDTPYAVYGRDDTEVIEVIGDPNKTEVKKSNYNIKFRYTLEELNGNIPEGAEVIARRFVVFNHRFDDITLNPAKDLTVVSCMMDIFPFFAELESVFEERNSEIENLEKEYNAKVKMPTNTNEEKPVIVSIRDKNKIKELEKKIESVTQKFGDTVVRLYLDGGDQLQLGLYNLVATLLGIDDDLGAHMLPGSVIRAVMTIFTTYPELINESEVLFGLS